jgi:hypothetical protein
MSDWKSIFKNESPIKVEIVKGVLEEKGIPSVIMNKKESVYQILGYYELMVSTQDALVAQNIIEKEIEL